MRSSLFSSSKAVKKSRPPTMRRFFPRLASASACLALLFFSIASATAATSTWSGASSVSWATTGNWTNGTVPGTGDTAVFGAAASNDIGISVGSGVTVNTIRFSSAVTGTHTITAGTGSITLDDAGTIVYDKIASGNFNQTISRPIVLSGSATFTNNNTSGNTLILSGAISGNGTIALTGSGGAGGATSNGGIFISGSNTSFSGSWDIRSGAVDATSGSAALGASSATVLLNGGILQLASSDAHNVSMNSNSGYLRWGGGATWSGTLSIASGVNGQFSTGGNDVKWSGAIVGDSTAGFFAQGSTPVLTLSGSISNTLSGTYTFNGTTGNYTLSKTNGATAVAGSLAVSPASAGTVTVKWTQPNQIADTSIVTLSSTGTAILQLQGNSDTIGGLVGTGSVASFVQNQTASTTGTLTFSVASGTSYTFAGLLRNGTGGTPGVLAIGMAGSGTQVLSGSNTFSGGATIQGGVLRLGHASALGTGTATVSAGTFNLGGLSTVANAIVLSGGTLANGTVNVSQLTANSGVVSASLVGEAFTKATAGKLTLTGSAGYTGITTITGGTLAIGAGGSIGSSSRIIVGNNGSTGAVLDVQSLGSGLVLGATQTIGGTGSILGNMTIAGGATLAPGNSPGILAEAGNVTWGGGGNYNWQIYDADSGAGTGWDLFNVTGSLAIAATGTDQFNINVWSLSGLPDTTGNVADFVDTLNYTWTIATFSDGITGFDANAFRLNLSATNGAGGFTNAHGGSFSVIQSQDAKSIQIAYVAAVPEPGTIGLAGVGIAVMSWAALRRRKRAG